MPFITVERVPFITVERVPFITVERVPFITVERVPFITVDPSFRESASIVFFFLHRVEFSVGDREVKSFRMIEKHYFKDTLLKCFDFEFGFCMPGSMNTCEHIYELPKLNQNLSKSHLLILLLML